MYLIYALLFSLGFNVAMFLVAYKKQTDHLTDISYALTFAAIAVYAYATKDNTWEYSWLVAAMVLIWATRLGGYLLMRIRKMGKDKRFDDKRDKFWKFLGFWVLQAATVWIVSLGFMMFLEKGYQPELLPFTFGFALWAAGLVIEAFADKQKFDFINNKANKGKWIDTGLWKYSRHPNYLGEILVWYGMWLAVAAGLSGSNKWLAGLSPVFIAIMLLFVSGIPLLEKSADKRWGKDPKYVKYKKSTSVLLLAPKRKV